MNKRFLIDGHSILLVQSPPYPAWVELSINNNKFSLKPEDFIQFVSILNNYCKYELKDSNGEMNLYKP